MIAASAPHWQSSPQVKIKIIQKIIQKPPSGVSTGLNFNVLDWNTCERVLNVQMDLMAPQKVPLVLCVQWQIKFGHPCPWECLHEHPDYKYTDKFLGLIMIILCHKHKGNCLLLHLASQAPNIDFYLSNIWPRPFTSVFDFDLGDWPWPLPLTFTSQKSKWQKTVMSKTLSFDLQPWSTIKA